jgi:hypothetical protein
MQHIFSKMSVAGGIGPHFFVGPAALGPGALSYSLPGIASVGEGGLGAQPAEE